MSKHSATDQPVTEPAQADGAARAGPAELKEFDTLADQWHRETDHLSNMSRKLGHPAYQRIVALGRPALPLILRDLRDRGGWWFEALTAITKEDPEPNGANYDGCRGAWLEWGKDRGLLK